MNNEIVIDDYKIIKKKYGEDMAHFCDSNFPEIIEKSGILSNIMFDYFEPSRFLYEDLDKEDKLDDFKNFIFSKFTESKTKEESHETLLTPEELLKQKGYILKECTTEEEIQEYKKYYSPGEDLCTFKGGRLNRCRVFFAVKENVDEIKREDFQTPRRQDEYGTSVISIQFSLDDSHFLSIKNRYNHRVPNCDATFSNDLDNIAAGLTESFAKYKGLKQSVRQGQFEIPGYICTSEGKYYKYNYEILGICYCPNNIIVKDGQVKKLEPEKYILMDYYILDLVNKRLIVDRSDLFSEELKDIEKIEVHNKERNEKEVKITCSDDKEVVITLDKYGRIVGYSNNKMEVIGGLFGGFLVYNRVLERIDIPNVKTIGYHALSSKKLKSVIIPEGVTEIDSYAFAGNQLTNVVIPEGVTSIGIGAFAGNRLTSVVIPEGVTYIGYNAFSNNQLTSVVIPKGVTEIDSYAFVGNQLTNVVIPEGVTSIGNLAFDSDVKLIKGSSTMETPRYR